VKILTDCGLITIQKRGRERYCSAQLDQLGEVQEWIAQFRQHWESKVDSLEAYIEKLKKEKYGKEK
jgi:hypothetical protein